MSGPIVRSGPSPQYTKNWAAVFGDRPTAANSSQQQEAKPEESEQTPEA